MNIRLLLHKFPLEGILLDMGLALLIFFSDAVQQWTQDHYATAYLLVGGLQCVAVMTAFHSFSEAPPVATGPLTEKIVALVTPWMTLMGILAIGGFMWLFIPALALNTGAGWAVFTLNFFVVLFGSLLGIGMLSSREAKTVDPVVYRLITAVGVFLYLGVSETLLLVAAATVDLPAIFMGVLLAYVPIRLLLVWRAPWNWLEMVTAVAAFGYFLRQLLSG